MTTDPGAALRDTVTLDARLLVGMVRKAVWVIAEHEQYDLSLSAEVTRLANDVSHEFADDLVAMPAPAPPPALPDPTTYGGQSPEELDFTTPPAPSVEDATVAALPLREAAQDIDIAFRDGYYLLSDRAIEDMKRGPSTPVSRLRAALAAPVGVPAEGLRVDGVVAELLSAESALTEAGNRLRKATDTLAGIANAAAPPATGSGECPVCGQTFPHYHRDTADGEEIVRLPAEGEGT